MAVIEDVPLSVTLTLSHTVDFAGEKEARCFDCIFYRWPAFMYFFEALSCNWFIG